MNQEIVRKSYPWKWLYGAATLGSVVLTLFASAGFSKAYWGYWFQRPDILPEAKSLTAVEQVIAVEVGTPPTFVATGGFASTDVDPDAYGFRHERHWYYLQQQGLLSPGFAFDPDMDIVADLYEQLPATDLLVDPEPGYETANTDNLSGVITLGTTATGERLALVSLTGGQLSNDHYPYYEMVFRIDPATSTIDFINGQRFFYEIAGIEGLEWYIVWIFLGPLGVVLAIGGVASAQRVAE